MVFEEIEGVLNVAPFPNSEPPVSAANQRIIPTLAVAPNATEPVPHLNPGTVLATVGVTLMVATTGVLIAVAHVPLRAST